MRLRARRWRRRARWRDGSYRRPGADWPWHRKRRRLRLPSTSDCASLAASSSQREAGPRRRDVSRLFLKLCHDSLAGRMADSRRGQDGRQTTLRPTMLRRPELSYRTWALAISRFGHAEEGAARKADEDRASREWKYLEEEESDYEGVADLPRPGPVKKNPRNTSSEVEVWLQGKGADMTDEIEQQEAKMEALIGRLVTEYSDALENEKRLKKRLDAHREQLNKIPSSNPQHTMWSRSPRDLQKLLAEINWPRLKADVAELINTQQTLVNSRAKMEQVGLGSLVTKGSDDSLPF